MIPYIITAILPILIYLPFQKRDRYLDNKSNKKTYIIISGFLIFLFLALRSRFIGSTDTAHYYDAMKSAIQSKSWEDFYNPDLYETGFQAFVYLLSRIFRDPQWIIVISTAIYVGAVCFFIYKNSDDVVMSLVMYVALDLMTFQMQGMRQAIAMSLCLLAYECAKNKKLMLFIILCALATTMHSTAIVFFIVYPIIKFKFSYFNIAIFAVVSLLVLILSEEIVAIGNLLFDKNYHSVVETGGYVATIIYVLILGLFMFFGKNLKNDNKIVGLFYITFVGFICFLLRYTGVRIAERISYYFIFGQLALLPKALNIFTGRERTVVKVITYILMIGLFAYRLADSVIIPYEFFWNAY